MKPHNQVPTQGEFRGDFTRDTFDPFKHFSRVLMQQGRVQLDADWNEQTDLLLHYMRQLARDVIGDHGGPSGPAAGFKITEAKDAEGNPIESDFQIGEGHYYVDGILCETQVATFGQQPGAPFPDSIELEHGQTYLVFLDVWERHVTSVQDSDLSEVALGGPDTTTRAQIVPQIKCLLLGTEGPADLNQALADLRNAMKAPPKNRRRAVREALHSLEAIFRKGQQKLATNGLLRARARVAERPDDPCAISPESQYRGAENQLYRVEIHQGGPLGKATFKWSRDNSSVVFPIVTLTDGTTAKLASLGRDNDNGLRKDGWVEVVDDTLALQRKPGPLVQVDAISRDDMFVTLKGSETGSVSNYAENGPNHPLLRRWDHESAEGALTVKEGNGEEDDDWITLEDGVQIQFNKGSGESFYRSGDYWLIPARVAIGDVLWPKEEKTSKMVARALPPHGVEHHCASLAVVEFAGDGKIAPPIIDLRRKFPALTNVIVT